MWSCIANTLCTGTPKKSTVSVASLKRNIFVCPLFEQDNAQNDMSLWVYDTVTSEWRTCANLCQSSLHRFIIARLRMPKRVLDMCEVLS